MNKSEFLHILRSCLGQLTAEEREQNIAYYEELFSDMLEEGMSEEEAAAHLGDPEQIAWEILAEQPLPLLVKSRVRPSGGWTALSITLIVLGSPVSLPLLMAAAAVILSVFVVIWALILSVLAVALAGGSCGGIAIARGADIRQMLRDGDFSINTAELNMDLGISVADGQFGGDSG